SEEHTSELQSPCNLVCRLLLEKKNAFANYFVPLQIGAKDVAFARLNATSYWLYVFAGLAAYVSFFVPGGAPAGGWTNYSPPTSTQYQPGIGETLGAAGLIVIAASNT